MIRFSFKTRNKFIKSEVFHGLDAETCERNSVYKIFFLNKKYKKDNFSFWSFFIMNRKEIYSCVGPFNGITF